jgi:hypothetical protein
VLSNEYFQSLWLNSNNMVIDSLEGVREKLAVSQLLKDLLQVSEATSAVHAHSRHSSCYRMLQCNLRIVDPLSEVYQRISAKFLSTLPEGVTIHRILGVNKLSETEQFSSKSIQRVYQKKRSFLCFTFSKSFRLGE